MLSSCWKRTFLVVAAVLLFCHIAGGFQQLGIRRHPHATNHDGWRAIFSAPLLDRRSLSKVDTQRADEVCCRYPLQLQQQLPRTSPPRSLSRRQASSDDNNEDDSSTSISSKLRSFATKLIDRLMFPLRVAVLKPLRWLRDKLRKETKVDEEVPPPPTEEELEQIEAKEVAKQVSDVEAEATAEAVANVEVAVVAAKVQEQADAVAAKAKAKAAEAKARARQPDLIEAREIAKQVTEIEAEATASAVAQTEVAVVAAKEQEQAAKAKAKQAPKVTKTKVPAVTKAPAAKVTMPFKEGQQPPGDHWAIAAPGVDLSGDWTLVVDDEFKKQYDAYLQQLGQPFLVRSVALTIVALTTEETQQSPDGRTLLIRGTNARGVWERTLVTSGTDLVNDKYTPLLVPIVTADDERVQAEAWWEDQGTVHRSWMRGLNKYGGGDFESKRYLDKDGKVLVCESIFHPREQDREDAYVTWRFLRRGETLS